MANTARKLSNTANAEAPIDVERARLVRRGPRSQVRMPLRALREAAGLTQAQVAKASGLVQPEISKLESATTLDDRMVSTVRRYVEALQNDLEIVAVSKHGHRIGIAAAERSTRDDEKRAGENRAPIARARHMMWTLESWVRYLESDAKTALTKQLVGTIDRMHEALHQIAGRNVLESDGRRRNLLRDLCRSDAEAVQRGVGSIEQATENVLTVYAEVVPEQAATMRANPDRVHALIAAHIARTGVREAESALYNTLGMPVGSHENDRRAQRRRRKR